MLSRLFAFGSSGRYFYFARGAPFQVDEDSPHQVLIVLYPFRFEEEKNASRHLWRIAVDSVVFFTQMISFRHWITDKMRLYWETADFYCERVKKKKSDWKFGWNDAGERFALHRNEGMLHFAWHSFFFRLFLLEPGVNQDRRLPARLKRKRHRGIYWHTPFLSAFSRVQGCRTQLVTWNMFPVRRRVTPPSRVCKMRNLELKGSTHPQWARSAIL